jgi:hypothetical protein
MIHILYAMTELYCQNTMVQHYPNINVQECTELIVECALNEDTKWCAKPETYNYLKETK